MRKNKQWTGFDEILLTQLNLTQRNKTQLKLTRHNPTQPIGQNQIIS